VHFLSLESHLGGCTLYTVFLWSLCYIRNLYTKLLTCSVPGNCFKAGCLPRGFTSKPTIISSWISSMDALFGGRVCNLEELYFSLTWCHASGIWNRYLEAKCAVSLWSSNLDAYLHMKLYNRSWFMTMCIWPRVYVLSFSHHNSFHEHMDVVSLCSKRCRLKEDII
jgi:hypothetical protein